MSISIQDVVRILLAIVAGGAIGLEREFRDKAAGFRTLIFICLGSTLFTLLAIKLAGDNSSRITANIVSGVGFLGAGVILRDRGKVIGLTTASAIWLTAALGMGIGGGSYLIIAVAVAAAMVVLWGFPWLEHRIDQVHEIRSYEVVTPLNAEKAPAIDQLVHQCGLHVHDRKLTKVGSDMVLSLTLSGRPQHHEQLAQELFADPEVKEFKF